MQAAEAKTVAIQPTVTTPDVPPAIAKCLEAGYQRQRENKHRADFIKKNGRPPTADELVVYDMQTTEERNKCALALLQWYRKLQQANKAAATKA